MSENYSPPAGQGKCFYLTSPFIEPATLIVVGIAPGDRGHPPEDERSRFVVSPVPKSEGPGAPSAWFEKSHWNRATRQATCPVID
jgi:hypothetical protein